MAATNVNTKPFGGTETRVSKQEAICQTAPEDRKASEYGSLSEFDEEWPQNAQEKRWRHYFARLARDAGTTQQVGNCFQNERWPDPLSKYRDKVWPTYESQTRTPTGGRTTKSGGAR